MTRPILLDELEMIAVRPEMFTWIDIEPMTRARL